MLSGAALFLGLTASADAYAVKRTTRGELVHWEVDRIPFAIDASVDRNVDKATDAIESSMASWSGTVGAPELTVAATADAPTKPGFDEKNGIFFVKGGYAPAGRALAITVLTYDNGSGRILDADVIFNGTYSFEVLAVPAALSQHTHWTNTDGIVHENEESVEKVADTYDLHHVVAHELGHTLGMNDEMGQREALMYRYSAPNDPSIREPAPDDIAGLAELYSTKLEGRGNGCGSATIAPKKPSRSAANAAAFATLGLLVFLVVRARSDRRARIGFVLAATGATIAFVPTLSGQSAGIAAAAESMDAKMLGHAKAHIVSASTSIENGLFKTTYELATTSCRAASCPKTGHGVAWGGTIGNVTQEVGNVYAPTIGSDVDVSFTTLPNAYRSLTKPLAGRVVADRAEARVVTKAR